MGLATVEVLVAVAIVLMVGTVSILTFGGNDRGQVRSEAADIALFLQQSRMRALEMGRPVEIILSADDGNLRTGAATHHFAEGIAVSPDNARLVLDPTGASDGLALTLRKGDQTAQVVLDWLTGRVMIQ